ncbi:hypothetical protein M0802_016915 [Mischocyttarus mexicanus]|nr:hypothetical protein M0802_016915 [Mischocyttarus mexicanus]
MKEKEGGMGFGWVPTYQNREAIEETITKSSSTTYTQNPSTGGKMPSLNNNLSELDTLLQDLSNARYNSQYHDRDSHVSTGGVNGGTTSPMLRSPSSMSAPRPTVDALLEELNTAVPNGEYPNDGRVKVTIQETSTEIEPIYDDYPSSQHGSLNRSEIQQRSYANGHTASNATKELDDLMASLSEFKV